MGDLLVGDPSEEALYRFHSDASASEFPLLGSNEIFPLPGFNKLGVTIYNQVAIDNSGTATDGDIYITQYKQDKVEVFSREGAHLGDLSGAGATPFGSEVCGVAVDGSGDVYVADSYPASKIYKYTPGVNPPVNGDVSESFDNATYPCQLAIGAGPTAGYLFYVEALDTGGGKVKKLDIEGPGKGEVKYTVDSANNNVNVAVDPTTGHVYTVHGQLLSEYDASGASEAKPVAPSGPAGSDIPVPEWNGNLATDASRRGDRRRERHRLRLRRGVQRERLRPDGEGAGRAHRPSGRSLGAPKRPCTASSTPTGWRSKGASSNTGRTPDTGR